ncbi:MAG: protein-disulfide reductase DsbD family protein [Ignavibacteria bacterium]|nr:protein-disulfide reductase DsbD family protein [Ignavibacteria bacterium]
MKKRTIISLWLIVYSFLILNILKAEVSNQHFAWKATSSRTFVNRGDTFNIRLDFEFEKGWYTYDLVEQVGPEGLGPQKTEIAFSPQKIFKLNGKIKTPKPVIKYDSAFQMKVRSFSGKFSFTIPLLSQQDIDFSKEKVYVEVYLQQCREELCLPALEFKTVVVPPLTQNGNLLTTKNEDSVSVDIVRQETEVPSETISNDINTEIETAKKQGLLAYLLFAMGAGALALLTPCVFPMIPITVSFFTKRAERNPGKSLRDSIIYGLGIILTFTTLGLLLAILFGATGIQDFATSPILNIGLALLFIVFAFNLFGAFEFQLPTSWVNALNVKSQSGSGIFSVLLMGLTFSLTTFTCTVPFVGLALVSAASGEWFYPIVGMLGFSFVFAIPFFLLALFPGFISKLPRSGVWMNNIKGVMGFLVIAVSLKFISNASVIWDVNILPRELFLSIWIGIGILITLYILGVFRLKHDTPIESIGTMRILFAIAFISISVYLLAGLFGMRLGELEAFLPASKSESVVPSGQSTLQTSNTANLSAKAGWFDNYEEALKVASSENKPIFIDFSGFTCTNCKWMETNMFTEPEVRNLLKDMVKVRLFTDKKEEPYISNREMQMKRFKTISIPLYVIQTHDEKVIATSSFTRDKKQFLDFLKKAYSF